MRDQEEFKYQFQLDQTTIEPPPPRKRWDIVFGIFLTGISVGFLIPIGLKFYSSRLLETPPAMAAAATPEARKEPKTREGTDSAMPAEDLAVASDASNAPLKERSPVASKSPIGKTNPSKAETSRKKPSLAAKADIKASKTPVVQKPAATAPIVGDAIAPMKKSVTVLHTVESTGKDERQKYESLPEGKIHSSLKFSASSKHSVASEMPLLASPEPSVITELTVKTAPEAELVQKTSDSLLMSTENVQPSFNEVKEKSERSEPEILTTIYNASYVKDTLAKCFKRCLLRAKDANGRRINAVVNGPNFADILSDHSGTINLTGKYRKVKTYDLFMVQNISFNLSPADQDLVMVRKKSPAKPVLFKKPKAKAKR